MADIIFVQNARLSFPHLVQAHSAAADGSNPRFSADGIIPPTDPAWGEFHQQVQVLAQEKWGAQAPAILQMCNQERKSRAYGAGEEKINRQTMQPYDGYVGHVYITGISQTMPQIIGPDGQQIDPTNTMACQAEARKMYGGCRVNIAFKPWLQDNQHGRAIRCDLVAVQFAGDDTPFGEAAPDASGMFGQVASPGGMGVPGQPGVGTMPTPGAVPGMAPGMPGAPPAAPQGVPGAVPGAPGAQPPMSAPPGAPWGAPAAPAAPQVPVTPAPAPGVPGMAPPGAPGAAPAAPGVVPGAAAPIQGPDGQWYDPTTGAVVAPPAMPGYPQ